ncbi:OsmC family protein [Fictibacillus sp. WQ 8-8]|uniref:OsmC family protein n=1 Tax=Fictibacillus sp. WQ 8-8 TaxID=2938788 RepID=UPI002109DBC0|nr:OsmC family protein [Fictibacillus sp. WQ 8-8]MCQ6267774.1 OsmC family protein [Fictibacillus sp. WQ 8-8]
MAQTSTLVKVSATGKWESGVKTNHSVRQFSPFSMDEPVELGGTDTSPNPIEYVAAALNGCNGVMIPLVAQEMGFTFTGIDFKTSGILDTRGLMGEEGVSPHFQKIRFQVDLQTEESEERVQQLKQEVEHRCPVYNLFVDANIDIHTVWKKN